MRGIGAHPITARLRRRVERQRLILRGIRRRGSLRSLADRTRQIGQGDILCLVTLRDERSRLPWSWIITGPWGCATS